MNRTLVRDAIGAVTRIRGRRWPALAGVLIVLAALVLPFSVFGDEAGLDSRAPDAVRTLWAAGDGPATRAGGGHPWVWGPALANSAREPFKESPGGSRQVFYFDKGRLEISDPGQPADSLWYLSSGLLVRDLIAGVLQVGVNSYVTGAPARIPLSGDTVGNALSPTYAALAPVASVGGNPDARRSPNRLGQPITAFMRADGSVVDGGATDSRVLVGAYGSQTGHNVAQPFAVWMTAQAQPWDFLVGYPLTEPYWIDTVVAGKQQRVLFQAFERRVLTYTPGNPDGWKVESGNVGQHYQSWHQLALPGNAALTWLATGVPFGEIAVAKASAYNLDPFLFAAVAQSASNFDPAAGASGHLGLFGVRPGLLGGLATPLEPAQNAEAAARELANLHQVSSDWRAVLALYYTGVPNPDWSDAGLNSFVNGVLADQATLLATFKNPPPAPRPTPTPVPTQAPAPAASGESGTRQHNTIVAPDLYLVDTGAAAYYDPSYSVAWWDWTLQRHANWGQAVPGWQTDPNGYYCVHPDYKPGDRLQLTAHGVTIWCTIGDSVAAQDEANWRAQWAVELSWNTFVALGLDHGNYVEVRHAS